MFSKVVILFYIPMASSIYSCYLRTVIMSVTISKGKHKVLGWSLHQPHPQIILLQNTDSVLTSLSILKYILIIDSKSY
jgi:hypothetical protein